MRAAFPGENVWPARPGAGAGRQRAGFLPARIIALSMLGGLGFSAYAAANHFMDAYVHDRNRRQRIPWTSVNWEGWQLETEQTIRGQAVTSISELLIAPAEGVELLRRCCLCGT